MLMLNWQLCRIVSYMTKQSLPAVSTLTSESHTEFKTADKVVIVAYFAADDKDSNSTFTGVAEKLRDDFLFGATTDVALAEAEGVKHPSIVLYKSFDEGKNTFTEKLGAEALTQFIKTASIPLVGEVGPETYAGYMEVKSDPHFQVKSANSKWLGRYTSCIYFCRNTRREDSASWNPQALGSEAQGCCQLCHHWCCGLWCPCHQSQPRGEQVASLCYPRNG